MSTIMEIYSRVLDCQPTDHLPVVDGYLNQDNSFICSLTHHDDYLLHKAKRSRMIESKHFWPPPIKREKKRAAWQWFTESADAVSLKHALLSQVSIN